MKCKYLDVPTTYKEEEREGGGQIRKYIGRRSDNIIARLYRFKRGRIGGREVGRGI